MARCSRCGAKLEPDDDFCPNCGMDLGASRREPIEERRPPKRRRDDRREGGSGIGKFILWTFVILIVTGIITALIFYIIGSSGYTTYEQDEFTIKFPDYLDYCDHLVCFPDHDPGYSGLYSSMAEASDYTFKVMFTNPDNENTEAISIFIIDISSIDELIDYVNNPMIQDGATSTGIQDEYGTGGKIITYYMDPPISEQKIRVDYYLRVYQGKGHIVMYAAPMAKFSKSTRDKVILSYKPKNGYSGYDYYDDKQVTTPPKQQDTNNQVNNAGSKQATQAYQDYIKAYNELTDLMSQGKGDTLEGKAAYAKYKDAKDRYEALAAQI